MKILWGDRTIPSGEPHIARARAVCTARTSPAVIPNGIATEGPLTFIIIGKFCVALPLYRQEKQLARLGVELPCQTMADWIIAVAAACQPLYEQLGAYCRSGEVLQIDETTLQVMRQAERKEMSRSYIWVIRGADPEKSGVLYHYAARRSAEVARELVGDFQRYLQSDGHEVCGRLCDDGDLTHVGCWAYARRQFVDAKNVGKNASSASQAIVSVGKLYAAGTVGTLPRGRKPLPNSEERKSSRSSSSCIRDFRRRRCKFPNRRPSARRCTILWGNGRSCCGTSTIHSSRRIATPSNGRFGRSWSAERTGCSRELRGALTRAQCSIA